MKVLKFIVSTVIIAAIGFYIVDFCRFPACHMTTFRYHLHSDLKKGDDLAIEHYERYLKHGRVLFE